MRGRIKKRSFPCFAPQGQIQGKTELFMVADLREMRENQRFSENRIDKSRFSDTQTAGIYPLQKGSTMKSIFLLQ